MRILRCLNNNFRYKCESKYLPIIGAEREKYIFLDGRFKGAVTKTLTVGGE